MTKYQERQSALKKAQAAQRQQMTLIGVVMVVVVLFFGLFLFVLNRSGGSNTQAGKYDLLYKTLTADGSPILGDSQTKLTVIEFSDFGCPYCLGYKPTVNEIIDKYVRTGQIRLIFSPQLFHQNSDVAATAALCADKQGKFWEMGDALFDIQSREGLTAFTVERLKQTAASLNLETSKWLGCMISNDMKQPLAKAYALFQKMGAQGTPTMMWSPDGENWQFFADELGQPYVSGGVPIELVAKTIDKFYKGKS